MNKEEPVEVKGYVTVNIEYNDGRKEKIEFKNTILRKGREALAKSLANDLGDTYQFYVNRMLFGDGGTLNNAPKHVDTNRNGLFGITRASKSVIAQVDPNISSQVIFTAVLNNTDANGYALNEMALQMSNGDLYSMATFLDLNKTDQMQITWNWRISFV
jgi:hypothetical protein